MNPTATELKQEIEKSLSQLRTLRDEVRVRMHLAGMEVKDEWAKLEPYLAEVERAGEVVTKATRDATHEALEQLSKIRSSLL